MPVIVEAEDNQIILADELSLVLKRRIGLQFAGGVFMGIKSGLVGNHHIRAGGNSLLQHFKRRHHRGRNAMNWSSTVPGNDAIDSLVQPCSANVVLDALNDSTSGETPIADFRQSQG